MMDLRGNFSNPALETLEAWDRDLVNAPRGSRIAADFARPGLNKMTLRLAALARIVRLRSVWQCR